MIPCDRAAALLLIVACLAGRVGAQPPAAPPEVSDPQIQEMVRLVRPDRLEADVRRLVEFGTRHTLSSVEDPQRGIGAARRWLKEQFEAIAAGSGGRLRVGMEGYAQEPDGRRITRPVEIVNVVASLTGRQKESAGRVYLVVAHYDSICTDPKDAECDAPGANDDGSGTAAILEAARVMSGFDFDATVVFLAVAGEEQGLYGSKHAAETYRRAGVNIAGVIGLDIVGSSTAADGTVDGGKVRVFSEGVPEIETPEQARVRWSTGSENDSAARQLARFIAEAGPRYVEGFEPMMIFRRDRFLRGGDHTSFSRAGYPAVRFTEPNEDYRHQHQNVRVEDGVQYGDLPQFVDYGYLAKVTRLTVAALASLARAPGAPGNVRLVTARLTTDTTLRWDAGAEPDLAGYEIVWRETTAPQWQQAEFVGNVTEYTASLSKDNYVFGVRTVDRAGHRSVAVYPQPEATPSGASQPARAESATGGGRP